MKNQSWDGSDVTLNKDLKAFLWNVQEFKENVVLTSEQIGNLSKEVEIIKKTQMEVMKLKSLVTAVKNSLDSLDRSRKCSEGRVSNLKTSTEIIQSE